MLLRFQLVHSIPATTFTLMEVLNTYLDEVSIPHIPDTDSWFEVERSFLLPTNKLATTFQLNIPEESDPAAVEDFTPTLMERFKTKVEADTVLLFDDSSARALAQEHQSEIYEIEMQLREILQYIFSYNDREDLSRALEVFGVSIGRSSPAFVGRPIYENELYFLEFGDYLKLEFQKPPKQEDLFRMLQRASTFDDFKETLNNRGLAEGRHRDFLAEVNPHINTIKEYRNTLMHNRTSLEATRQNYLASFIELTRIVTEFWRLENANSLVRVEQQRPAVQRQALETVQFLLNNGLPDPGASVYTLQPVDAPRQVFNNYEDLRDALIDFGRNSVSALLPADCSVDVLLPDHTLEEITDGCLRERQALWQTMLWS